MKRAIFNSTSFLLALLLISGFSFRSCNKEQAPELPPVSSMVMDFSDFQDSKKAADATEETYVNWVHSAAIVLIWNTITTVTMAVPVTAYTAMLDQKPVYLGDNTWQWSANVTIGLTNYTGKLVGTRISNDEFTMEMYISAIGVINYDEWKWFEGTIRYDHTHAEWTLYENPTSPSTFLSIEYNIDFEADNYDIKYTNIQPESTENGSWIQYAYDSADTVYNSSYVISASANTIDIEWSREDKDGRVMDPAFFSDELWHYWNELLQDYVPE